MKKNIIILLMCAFLLVYMFIYSNEVVCNTKDSIDLLIKSFIPSLLPYMVVISLINELGGLLILGYLFQFILKPVFNINAKESSLVIAGLISGYPLPSVLVSSQNKLTKKEKNIISIFVFPSFAFLLNHIIPNLNNLYRLLLSFILGAFILLFITNYKDKEKVEYLKFSTLINLLKDKYKNVKLSKLIRKVFINSAVNMIVISSNILIFSLCSLLISSNSQIGAFIQGLLDFSRASIKLSSNASYLSYLMMIFILLFGGVSIFMQNSAILSHTNFSLKNYIINRIKLIIIVIIIDLLIFF